MEEQKIEEMTDRELLEESVRLMRSTRDTVNDFLNSLGSNPMFRAMAGAMAGNGKK